MTDKKNQKTDRQRRATGRKGLRHNSGGGRGREKRKEWTLEFDRPHIWSWWTDPNFLLSKQRILSY